MIEQATWFCIYDENENEKENEIDIENEDENGKKKKKRSRGEKLNFVNPASFANQLFTMMSQ